MPLALKMQQHFEQQSASTILALFRADGRCSEMGNALNDFKDQRRRQTQGNGILLIPSF